MDTHTSLLFFGIFLLLVLMVESMRIFSQRKVRKTLERLFGADYISRQRLSGDFLSNMFEKSSRGEIHWIRSNGKTVGIATHIYSRLPALTFFIEVPVRNNFLMVSNKTLISASLNLKNRMSSSRWHHSSSEASKYDLFHENGVDVHALSSEVQDALNVISEIKMFKWLVAETSDSVGKNPLNVWNPFGRPGVFVTFFNGPIERIYQSDGMILEISEISKVLTALSSTHWE